MFPKASFTYKALSRLVKELFRLYIKEAVNLSPETSREEAKGEAGRKSKYSIKKVREICNHVLRGIPLRYASPLCGIPFGTAKGWLAEHPEMGEMLEEAHGKFVQNHVGNIERHAKASEKPSQWLLERRASKEFSPAYAQPASAPTLNVAVLGNDALGKLMAGWSGMLGGQPTPIQVESQRIPDTNPTPTLLAEHITESSEAPAVKLEAVENKIEAPNAEEVKPKRGRGRPRKYPKPDTTPATPPPAPHP